ncbi:phosphoribosyltransferase [Roseomonas sp. NAR14]|uniref:Phosphoribosyltransferase n=1 Tax=Roseomonas acroporae TaxID=2937791 RepID=A0A9X2BWM3_9PROT|nr:phosphoribosyltransferase [Roseomonas acroporae]MCK8785114.1 phosphoribosyltransferase [Roseomonas acroporae]
MSAGTDPAMGEAAGFWQEFLPADPGPPRGPWTDRYPAAMPDGSRLVLPLRDFGDLAVTGLIANQASFAVCRRLAGWMAEAARPLGAEAVVGLPTLGHVFGPLVAEALGHRNWVAPGYSRKRWYDEALSVPVASSTAPGERRMWLDPRLLPRLAGRRVLLVDDVISTGSSALAGLALLRLAGVVPVGLCVAMAQGDRWLAGWDAAVPVAAAYATPLFRREGTAWVPRPESVPVAVTLPAGQGAAPPPEERPPGQSA